MKRENLELIVVLGMHRSGTSIVTCGLQTMGINLGSNLMPPKQNENDIGFFEDMDVNLLNIEMLEALGSDWHSIASLPKDFPQVLRDKGFLLKAVTLLRAKVLDFPRFAFKDPRTARLLPFWREVFESCHLEVSYVVVMRNPISVAASLVRRNSFDFEKGIALWTSHNLEILQTLGDGSRSLIVDYDRFIETPSEELNRIAAYLGCPLDQEKFDTFLLEAHKKELRHCVQNADDVFLNDFAAGIAGGLYVVLQSGARANGRWETDEIKQKISKVAADFERTAISRSWIDRIYVSQINTQRQLNERVAAVGVLNLAITERSSQIASLTHIALERDRAMKELFSQNAELQNSLLAANEAITALRNNMDELRQSVDGSETANVMLKQDLSARERDIDSMTHVVEELKNGAAQLKEAAIHSQNEIGRLTREVADRSMKIQEATRAANDRTEEMNQLEGLVVERDREIATMRAMSAEQMLEIRHLTNRLVETENRTSELRNLILDRDAKFRTLADSMIQDSIFVGAAGRLPNWRQLVELDGFVFVREAYLTLLQREPDPTGKQFYLARLRMGLPKLTILGELQNSAEGRRINAQVPGLQSAVKRQALVNVPLMGSALAVLFGAEKNSRLHARIRALQQQVLGISSIIRSQLNTSTTANISGRTETQETWSSPVSDSSDESRTASSQPDWTVSVKRSVGENSAMAGSKPVVFQFDYKVTASPASVGQNADTRQLALGFRRLGIIDQESKQPLCEIDFTSEGNSREFMLFGFGVQEPWGTWSVGRTSALVVWLKRPVPGAIGVTVDASPFAGASPVTECMLTSSMGHRKELVLHEGKQQFDVALTIVESGNPAMFFHEPLELEYAKNVSLSGVTPIVSIIILNFNKPQISILSARAVLASSIAVPYEVIIVDNGSSLELYEILQLHDIPVRLVRVPVNRYFGEGNNIGAEAARGEFLVFLNNDAFPSTGCIDALVEAFRNDPRCGVAGPVFRYPDGRLQEAGALVFADGKALQRGKFEREFDVLSLPDLDVVDYVSAACLMIPARLFSEIGGFNYRYDPAYYEDTDLCFRVRLRGKRAMLVSHATCVHIENATTGDKKNKSDTGGSTVDHNREVFLSSWGTFLSQRQDASLPTSLVSPSYVQIKTAPNEIKNVAYSPYPLVPGGGERYILATALGLNKLGAALFVTPDPYSRLRLDNVMFDLGLPIGQISTLSVDKIGQCRLERAIMMGNELFPHFVLPAEKSFFHCQFPFPEAQLTDTELQNRKRNLAKCQKVIVNSEFTKRAYAEALDKHHCSATIEVVNPPVATERLLSIQRDDRPFILSIGRFSQAGHDKRQDVLIDAMKTTSKAFREQWTLILCGNVPNNPRDREYFKRLQESVGSEIDVQFSLSPSSGTMDLLRSQCSIYAHACGYGVRSSEDYWKCEHFGITLVEALVAGSSIICYEVGGGPEIINKVGAGETFGSVEELAFKLEGAAAGHGVDNGVRTRTAQLYGDRAFSEKLGSIVR